MFTRFDFARDATTDTTAGRFATFFENGLTDDWGSLRGVAFSLAFAGLVINDAINTNDNPEPKVFL
ncbi:MAG: hypothetical protein F2545_01490 [Actinobacteria bacterium]|nr:hypothetical protein [Actinomycetota bacterium]